MSSPTPTFPGIGGNVDGPDEPDEVGLDLPKEETELSLLVAEINAPQEAEAEELWAIPGRPGWHARYRHILDYHDLDRITKAATKKSRTGRGGGEPEIDALRVASTLLAKFNTGLLRNGRELVVKGETVTFAHPALLEELGLGRGAVRDAVLKIYGKHVHVLAHGNKLSEVSGWLDPEAGDEDPTEL